MTKFTMTELREQVEAARRAVTNEDWGKAIQHSRGVERDYWRTDAIHEAVEPVIVSLDDDESDMDQSDSSEDEL